MSVEELNDMEKARAGLEHYKKIYEIFEYCADLNITSTTVAALWPEIEDCMRAYYGI